MADIVGIGARLAAARAKMQASQVKAAARLEISEASYKNYETEKRDLPLAVAVEFCEAFDVDLGWLVYGTQPNAWEKATVTVSETIEALFSEAQKRKLTLSPSRAAKIGAYIHRTCAQNGTSPATEAGPIFDMIHDE
jgi:DNA-binding XRE family transcriptional regulator